MTPEEYFLKKKSIENSKLNLDESSSNSEKNSILPKSEEQEHFCVICYDLLTNSHEKEITLGYNFEKILKSN
jgi:hypothetical protein